MTKRTLTMYSFTSESRAIQKSCTRICYFYALLVNTPACCRPESFFALFVFVKAIRVARQRVSRDAGASRFERGMACRNICKSCVLYISRNKWESVIIHNEEPYRPHNYSRLCVVDMYDSCHM